MVFSKKGQYADYKIARDKSIYKAIYCCSFLQYGMTCLNLIVVEYLSKFMNIQNDTL